MGRDGGLLPARAAAWLVALTILAIGAAGLALQPDRAEAGWGAWVSVEQANLRAEPGAWADIIGAAWQGEWVDIAGGPTDDGWYEVAAPSAQGWIDGALLAFDDQAAWQGYGGESVGERWIDVDRGDGTVTLYEGEAPLRTWWAAMSADSSDDGFYATAIGTYHVYAMNEDLAWTDWGEAWITSWVGFDPDRMNGFHSFLLDEHGVPVEGGDGPTGGCVALPPAAAGELYWFVQPGTRVEVHW